MGSAISFRLVPMRKLINIVKTRGDVVEDVWNAFQVSYNLSESSEDDEYHGMMKKIIETTLPRYFNRNEIVLDGLDDISEIISDELSAHYGEDIWDPLITPYYGYFEPVIMSEPPQLLFALELVNDYYPTMKLPNEIDGVRITHSSKWAHLISWEALSEKPIDEPLIMRMAKSIERLVNNRLDPNLKQFIKLCNVAIEREEDLLIHD